MNMHHINQREVKGERFEAPHARTIKHLAAPWTFGTRNIWLGISIVQPNNSSNLHSHDDMEEIFYIVSGRGRIRIDDEEEDIEPGSCIYIPTGASHQLINNGNEILEVVAASSPPFNLDRFKDVHKAR
jgi:mannose-6-phosphate isomerase-like protein (cupin superfamily)